MIRDKGDENGSASEDMHLCEKHMFFDAISYILAAQACKNDCVAHRSGNQAVELALWSVARLFRGELNGCSCTRCSNISFSEEMWTHAGGDRLPPYPRIDSVIRENRSGNIFESLEKTRCEKVLRSPLG